MYKAKLGNIKLTKKKIKYKNGWRTNAFSATSVFWIHECELGVYSIA